MRLAQFGHMTGRSATHYLGIKYDLFWYFHTMLPKTDIFVSYRLYLLDATSTLRETSATTESSGKQL